jgi:hypothetical protein
VALSTTPRLTEPERLAGPSAPRSVTPYPDPTLLRALRSVSRSVDACAVLSPPRLRAASGSILPIENGSRAAIGTTCPIPPSHPPRNPYTAFIARAGPAVKPASRTRTAATSTRLTP